MPTLTDGVIEFCKAVVAAPAAVPVRAGPRHWALLDHLCRVGAARGNLVPDAYLAAPVIEHGATLASADRGFLRYPGIRLLHPLEG